MSSNGGDQGTEAEYLDSQYDDDDYAMVNLEGDESEGGEFVRFPNRARDEARRLLLGHQHDDLNEPEGAEADHQKAYQGKRDLYAIAKAAKVGEMIACPNCRKMHKKTTYHKVFCNNQKTHPGKRSCKDRYWNTVDATRTERATKSVKMQGK